MVTEGSNVKEGARRVRPLPASPLREEKGGLSPCVGTGL